VQQRCGPGLNCLAASRAASIAVTRHPRLLRSNTPSQSSSCCECLKCYRSSHPSLLVVTLVVWSGPAALPGMLVDARQEHGQLRGHALRTPSALACRLEVFGVRMTHVGEFQVR